MEYTVQKLARLAGVSTRTLRYYDQIGLLTPARVSSSGYRIYGAAEVDRLQQILFYRELGMGLAEIAHALHSPHYDRIAALHAHLAALEARQQQTALLIDTVQKTIEKEKGNRTMTDQEKFNGLKEKMIQENENKYGAEIREKYGMEAVEASNAKMMGLTEEEYGQMEALSQDIWNALEAAVQDNASPQSEAGREVVQMHKKWLGYTWGQYSAEAHKGLGEMYVADERFAAYYDRNIPGCAAFLRDAIAAWA